MTTDPTVPDAAVRIAADIIDRTHEGSPYIALNVVAALARAGWLHDPATVSCGEGHDPTRICCAHAKDVKALRVQIADELDAEVDVEARRVTRKETAG